MRLRNFSKIRLEHFCRLSMFYPTAKFQKKVMDGFRETAIQTEERTDERTDESDSLGLQRLRRETKKVVQKGQFWTVW